MMELKIDGKSIRTRENFYNNIKTSILLPEYFSENLDALWDVLSSYSNSLTIEIENQEDLVENLGSYGQAIIKLFQDAEAENENIKIKRKEKSYTLKYKNPQLRDIRGSHLLLVVCGHCKTEIAEYQKQGRGNLIRMHVERIIRASVDYPEDLNCPNCGELLGNKIELDGEYVYRMLRGQFNTRELD